MSNLNPTTFYWECTECGEWENNADTIIAEWLYVMDCDGYLCRSCNQKSKHDGKRWGYLPFYLHCYDCLSPSVQWTPEWTTNNPVVLV